MLAKHQLLVNDRYSLIMLVFDGCMQSKVQVLCQSSVTDPYRVAALEWYNGANGYFEAGCPTLAVCFNNGRCQFMRHEHDEGVFNCCVTYASVRTVSVHQQLFL